MKSTYTQPQAEVITLSSLGIMANDITWNGTSQTIKAQSSDSKQNTFFSSDDEQDEFSLKHNIWED